MIMISARIFAAVKIFWTPVAKFTLAQLIKTSNTENEVHKKSPIYSIQFDE